MEKSIMDKISFTVNGVNHKVGGEVSSDLTLLDYIRGCLELRGTKYMCREAGCGACIVTARRPPGLPYAVNSCMMTITACHGLEITTIEGVGNRKKGYHPLQTTLAEHNGTQCGYCSPGWIMAMFSLLRGKADFTMLEIEQSLGSNVCRCTGYRPILEAFKKFAKDSLEKQILDIEDLYVCKKPGTSRDKSKNCNEDWCMVEKDDVADFSIIELKLKDGKYWYRVVEVKNIFEILQEKGDDSYMLVAGNTAKGAYPIDEYPRILIDINGVIELKGYKIDQNLIIGAAVTLTELMDIFKSEAKQEYFEYLLKLYDHLKKIAHIPVRNLGTIAGNLMIKHTHNFFPSDIFLLLETVGAQLTIGCFNSVQTVTMHEFLKMNMKGVVILNVMLPPLSHEYKFVSFKVMSRSINAHAIVNAGFLYQLSSENTVLKSRIVFGGLSPLFNRALRTEEYLVGKNLFKNDILQSALSILKDELVVKDNLPEPSVEFRQYLALSLFYKGLLTLCPENMVSQRYRSGSIKLHDTRPVSRARQIFDTDPSVYPLNQPVPKIEALIQCAGEAFYSDDLPSQPYEVYAAFALTTVGNGNIVSINPTAALSQPGVIAFYSAKDIPSINSFTPTNDPRYLMDEEVFCNDTVKYFNQPFGIIVAETQVIAERAAKMVEVEYKNAKKPVLDVKHAIKEPERVTLFDSIEATAKGNDIVKVIKSGYTLYSQYHFAMENIVCVIHPTEEGLKVYTATQWTEGVQMAISRALKIDQNCIDVYVRRLGGSYGLKISRGIQSAVACALVVHKLNRPCRFVQSLTSTTRAVGKKLPCTTNYEVKVNSSGVIQYLNYSLYQDNGYTINEIFSPKVMSSYYNCYDRSRWNFKCFNAMTDTAKNSWLRAPGAVDTTANAELLMDQIAYELSLDPTEVRLNNIDRERYSAIEEMFNTLKRNAKYVDRRSVVNKYNIDNRWKKRGLRFSFFKWSTVPIGALNVILSVYRGDGTVVITHGGIEMGQGINTKAIQICAYYLKVPIEKIQIKGTDTVINPNNIETSGSLTSQNIGLSVRKCCEKLLERLEPIRNGMPDASWEEIITEAYSSNIDLQVQSFVSYDDSERYSYDAFGVSLAEVEIDVLTGESEILRVDVMEDVGKSVSPEIDIGQVEGAFIMGIGYWTSEKLVYDSNTGELLTNRTWNYQVPMDTDIPQDFRVYFRSNSYSHEAIHGAKAVGEPPLCSAVVVALAIREAISQARLESGIPTTVWFPIDGPSTVEVIGLSTATNTKDFKFN